MLMDDPLLLFMSTSTLILCFSFTGMTSRLKNTAGAITLSKTGDVGISFSSKRMAWAYIKSKKIFYGIEKNEVHEEEYISA